MSFRSLDDSESLALVRRYVVWRPARAGARRYMRLLGMNSLHADRRTRYRRRLSELLLESRLVYAGQGYCLALSRFGTCEDAAILVGYLDRYLPARDRSYDQNWAIEALLHLDDRLGTEHAQRFLTPGGLWHRSAFAGRDRQEGRHAIGELCRFADRLGSMGS